MTHGRLVARTEPPTTGPGTPMHAASIRPAALCRPRNSRTISSSEGALLLSNSATLRSSRACRVRGSVRSQSASRVLVPPTSPARMVMDHASATLYSSNEVNLFPLWESRILPRWYRGWSLLRRSSFGYEGREPLPQGRHFIADRMAQRASTCFPDRHPVAAMGLARVHEGVGALDKRGCRVVRLGHGAADGNGDSQHTAAGADP